MTPAVFRESDSDYIHIGLVNNMPSAALEATERQFRTLLGAAAEGMRVRLSVYALPEIQRSDAARRHIDRSYTSIDELWNRRLDGLIVTGTEPVTPDLVDEPYWGSLTRLVEWAKHNTESSVWSCLAAQAAVLQMDGIRRRTLGEKLSGVFGCARVADNALTQGLPERWQVPHSRRNDIPEDALAACGYRVLTRSAQAGADTFVKRRKSLFVLFQGHPEYEADSLLLEYRRDIRKFLRGERDLYPAMPAGCCDEDTGVRLAALRNRALSDRSEKLLGELSLTLLAAEVKNTWRPTAVSLYRNWLLYVSTQKGRRSMRIGKFYDIASPAPLAGPDPVEGTHGTV